MTGLDLASSPPLSLAGTRPGLGVISLAQDAGGVAYVGRLLNQVLRDADTEPWTIELGVERRDAVGLRQRASFAIRLLLGQLQGRVDWMMFNHAGVARAQYAIPKSIRLPYGVFVHDIEAWAPELDAARRAMFAGARVVVANSDYTARRVEAVHGDGVKVFPCPLGLLDGEREAGTRDPALLASIGPAAALIVGRVTSDERYKGHDQLIEAWPTVVAAVPNAQLLVAGWGDDIARLQHKARRLGVGRAVTFFGYVSESVLTDLFQRAAVYAMPSQREGFGLVYLEAMRAGVPCVGSTSDAAGEVIAHGESGFVVDRTDRSQVSAALITLLSDPTRRALMGAAGRRRYESHFTYAHFRARLIPILWRAFVHPRISTRSNA